MYFSSDLAKWVGLWPTEMETGYVRASILVFITSLLLLANKQEDWKQPHFLSTALFSKVYMLDFDVAL